MTCERTRRPILFLVALAAVTVALTLPPAGRAAEREEPASGGLLARGSGYGSPSGSDPVRTLQRRLRGLGQRPGPIDGLYGPLTQGAVERFQQGHGLAVDGIVGRQTRRKLYPAAQPIEPPAHHETQPGTLERKSPAPQTGAESADERQPARPAPSGAASRDGPQADTSVPPEIVALVAALAGLLLLAVLWKSREASVNFGLVCAALLGMFGIGAAVGATFATRAAPDGVGEARAQTGALLAEPKAADRARGAPRRHKTVARAKARRIAVDARVAAPPADPVPAPIAPRHRAPATTPVAPVQRAESATYVVKPGDSLSAIAQRQLAAGSSSRRVVEKVEQLTKLNLGERIRSGDPDLLEAGEELRLR